METLEGQRAVVTGGARGIGRAVVRRLVAEGATVVFSYARDDAAAAEVAGERAHAVRADQAEPAEVERLFAVADEVLGGVDVLVGNAGVAASTPLAEVTLAEYERVMAVNARGTFLAVQQAARRLGEGGRIVVVSSVTTVWPSPGESVYAASKAAVEQIARVASRELGPRGVTVNTVSPGVTDTDLLRAAAPPEAVAGVAGMTPLRRLGTPADVADVVAFLCGPDARWVTGQNLRADGGLV